jgi:O-antigen/teichoic acid export membrane protein
VASGQLVKFVAADYVGSLFWLVSTTFLPVIVAQQAGAAANAYFYLAWTIAYSLYLISPNMGSSLTVEASRDEAKLGLYSFRVFRHTAQLVTPAVAVVVVGAPYLLQLFGGSYAAAATPLLRLLALSAIPNIINALYISIARVQRHLTAMVLVLAALCGLVVGLSLLLLPRYGITGVGLGWLIGQTMVAVTLLLTRLPRIWLIHPEEEGHRPGGDSVTPKKQTEIQVGQRK